MAIGAGILCFCSQKNGPTQIIEMKKARRKGTSRAWAVLTPAMMIISAARVRMNPALLCSDRDIDIVTY
jgi:hypothetical protein